MSPARTSAFGPVRRSRPATGGSLLGLGSAPGLTLLTAAVIVLALAVGGGTQPGLWSDSIVDLASLGLLAIVLPGIIRRLIAEPSRGSLVVAALVVLPPLYQLLPLPPALWTHLPSRDVIAATFSETGSDLPWLPVSLDPAATWRSLLSLLPAIAVFLATQRLGLRPRRTLSLVFVALGLVSVLLGLAQVTQGPASGLRLFSFTHTSNSVGFFANRNHYAALLYCLIPVVAAWIVGFLSFRKSERVIGLVCCVLAYVALLLGLGMAASRTGMALAIVGAIASLGLVFAQRATATRRALAIMAAPIALGSIVIVEFALLNLLGRFDADALADYRFRIAATTVEAAKAFQPVGSGLGTFVPVYQMFEKGADLIAMYINHAHNDWLELWLEGGWPALLILAGLLVWLGRAAVRAWWRRDGDAGEAVAIDEALPRAASIAVLLLLVHSALDYPLRTTALMTVMAFCCALLTPAPSRVVRSAS